MFKHDFFTQIWRTMDLHNQVNQSLPGIHFVGVPTNGMMLRPQLFGSTAASAFCVYFLMVRQIQDYIYGGPQQSLEERQRCSITMDAQMLLVAFLTFMTYAMYHAQRT